MATIEIVQIKSEPEDEDNENITQEPIKDNKEEPIKNNKEEPIKNNKEEPVADSSQQPIADSSQEPMDDFTEKPIEGEFISPLELLRQHMTEPAIASLDKNIKKIKVRKKYPKVYKKGEKVVCEKCNKEFAGRHLLLAHARIHVEGFPYKCNKCGQRFKVNDYLLCHIRRVHKGIRRYECDVCGMKFQSSSGLKGHMRIHTGERPFKCDECGKAFNRSHILTVHKLTHTGERKYKCHICDKTFNRDFVLNNHMLIHTNEKPFTCSFCEYACRDPSTLRKHEAIHMGTSKVYSCKLCSSSFKMKCKLKRHVAERHLNLDVRVQECEICHNKFKSRQGLIKHIDIMHKKLYEYQCQICDKKFSNKHNMKEHNKRHYEDKPFVCDLDGCDKTFKTKSDLSRHMRIHDTSKHYPCPTCGRLFSRKKRMILHTDIHKVKWKDTPCPHCDSCFYNESYLAKHIRVKHNRTESFECDYCGLISKNKPGLVMHIRQMHIKTKELKCNICYKKFKNLTPLKLHYWSNHRIRHKQDVRKKKKIEIKQEIIEVEDKDLEKFIMDQKKIENIITDEKELNANIYATGEITTEVAKSLISVHCRDLRKVPEAVFDQLYIDSPTGVTKPEQDSLNENKRNSLKELTQSLPVARVFIQDIFRSRRCAKIFNYKKTHNGDIDGLMTLKKKLKEESKKKKKNIKEGLDQIIIKNVQQKYGKHYQVKINLVQCPVCMKLFETKEILAEHTAKYHPSNNPIKNKTKITKTIKNTNKIQKSNIKTKPKPKLDNNNKNVNNKVVLKSRLVRKGKNWIVENLPQKVNENEIQEIINNNTVIDKTDDKEDLTTDQYLENLKAMGLKARKEGKKILYPCDKCPKVCTAFCGIKTHRRIHNTAAKPYKPKIWKHKQKNIEPIEPKAVIKKINNAKPQPIKHKHKCDDKLKEFYKNCIRGSNIEFEQFLKIFNKIDRDNVSEFGPIEQGREFNEENYINNKNNIIKQSKKIVKKQKYRVLNNLSRKMQLERINKIKELRRNIKSFS